MDTTDDTVQGNTHGLGGPTEGGNPVSADDATHIGQDHATPGPSTHDIRNAIYHAPRFKPIIEELQPASRRASFNPGSISRYDSVNVLVIIWENDDLRVRHEANQLKSVFADSYGFNVQECCLPSHQPSDFLSYKMHKLMKYDDCVSNLLIVYYAGHCYLGPSREVMWTNLKDRENEHYAEMNWSVCEERLHDTASDTLFLLDCCFAAGAASRPFNIKGFSETLAACGWESSAPGPGPHSFTNTLLYTLNYWAKTKPNGFSVANLHTELLVELRSLLPQHMHPGTGSEEFPVERRRTPVHYIRSSAPSQPSIVLSPLKRRTKVQVHSSSKNPASNDPEHKDSGATQQPRSRSLNVILSITLAEDIPEGDSPQACHRWLASFPLPTKDIKVEAIFVSRSTGVLVSVPVEVWDLLPDIPGANFVCFARSDNLLVGPGQSPIYNQKPPSSDSARHLSEKEPNLPLKSGATMATKSEPPQTSHRRLRK